VGENGGLNTDEALEGIERPRLPAMIQEYHWLNTDEALEGMESSSDMVSV
jgi:hypothetical protein